jgi:starvation-inducible DNA-binding protein
MATTAIIIAGVLAFLLLPIWHAVIPNVRKLGGTTLRSIGHVRRLQRVLDNDADFVTPLDMLRARS